MRQKVSLVTSSIGKLATKRVPSMLRSSKPVEAWYRTPDYVRWSRAIRERASFRCEQCGRVDTRMFADHIKEVKDGGSLFDLNNGMCLCGSCHVLKTNVERLLRAERKKKLQSGGEV